MVVAGTADAIMMVEGEAQRDRRGDAARGDRAGRTRRSSGIVAAAARACGRGRQREVGVHAAGQERGAVRRRRGAISATGCARPSRNPDKVVRLEGTESCKTEIARPLRDRHRWRRCRATLAKDVGEAFEIAAQGGGPRRDPRATACRPDGRDPGRRSGRSGPGRLPAARPRLGHLHPRPDPGAHRRHPRLDGRGAAARLDQPGGRASATSTTTTSRRSASAKCGGCAGPSRRDIGHGALAERALMPCHPGRGRVPVHHAPGLRGRQLERLDLDGERLRQHAGADGRRRADQGAGRRRRDGPRSPSRRRGAATRS